MEFKEDLDSDSKEPAEPETNCSVDPRPGGQFGIAALFWATFVVGISLSYLQQLDGPNILLGGLLTVVIGVVAGLIVGYPSGRIADALFWSTLIAAFGYMSVARDPLTRLHLQLAWAVVGAFTGAVGATILTKRPIAHALLCGGVALATMFVCWTTGKQQLPVGPFGLDIDLFAAPLVGIAIAIFLRILDRIEARHKTPRYVTATWLMGVVIVGNLIAG